MATLADAGGLGRRAVAVRRRLSDPEAIAAALGLAAQRNGGSVFVLCAWHAERTPSCSLRNYDDQLRVHCFGCGFKGSALDLIAAVHGLTLHGRDFARVVDLAEAIAGTSQLPSPPKWPTWRTPPPSPASVEALWNDCTDVTANPDVVAFLQRRGLDPGDVVDGQLARALPSYGTLPRFARTSAGTWRDTGHLCVLPTFDAASRLVGLRARYVGTSDPLKSKELAPCGGCAGIFANALARQMLAAGKSGAPVRVVIAEGSMDFLSWATAFSDADEGAPGVLGIYSGAWSLGFAERVPSGSEVHIRTHGDEAGERYRAALEVSLADRAFLLLGHREALSPR